MGGDDRSWEKPSVVDRRPDVVTLVDAAGRRLYTSPAIEPVLGYEPQALVGQSAFDHVHPTDAERVVEIFDEGIDTGRRSAGTVFRYRAAAGDWRWLESVGVNLLDDPRVGAVVVDSRDVTARADRPPRGDGDDVPPETGPFGLVVLDAETEVVAATDAAAALVGHAREDLVGSRIAARISDDWLRPAAPAGPLGRLAGRGDRRPSAGGGVLEFSGGTPDDPTLEVSVVPVPAGPVPEPATVVGVRERASTGRS